MRSVTALLGLSLLVASSTLVACAPAEEDDADGSQQNVTGGSGSIESPIVYLFDTAQTTTAATLPKCVGAMLGKKVAVTAKACAKKGMRIGRASEKDGRRNQATVTKVHVPEEADADIAVVEFDREIGGTRAVITHTPLREGYSIQSYASANSSGTFGGLFSPDKGEAASIVGRMTSETETHGTIFPNKGSQICAGDIGAPVCSSTSTKVVGFEVRGTCGLSGIIVGAESVPATTQTPNGSNNATGETQQPAPAANGCSANGWKVAQLGRYAKFLRQHAPDAFKPIDSKIPLVPDFAPEGMWGYKSGGNVAKCKVETTKLDPITPGGEAKLTAKVSFQFLQSKAAPFGRVGIASKTAPTKMRWLPAKQLTAGRGQAFETTFVGTVSALTAGDYVVGFRASGNGGESWTQCDLDGIENGFSVDRLLELKVATAGAPTAETPPAETPPAETPPAETPPAETPPAETTTTPTNTPPPPAATESSGSSSDYSDPSGDDYTSDDSDSDSDEADETETVAKKKKKTSDGCSATPGSVGTSGLPMLGVLLGLAAVIRRRR